MPKGVRVRISPSPNGILYYMKDTISYPEFMKLWRARRRNPQRRYKNPSSKTVSKPAKTETIGFVIDKRKLTKNKAEILALLYQICQHSDEKFHKIMQGI